MPRYIPATLLFALILIASSPSPAAQPTELWLFYATNLQVDANVTKLEQIWRRAAKAGYSHVLLSDSKFAMLGQLGDMQTHYFDNLAHAKKLADELHLEIVPALFHVGYSSSILAHDPNLAEGLPVIDSLFIVKNNVAHLTPDPPVSLPPRPDWRDDNVTLGDALATVRNNTGNARFVFKLNLSPFRSYHVSVKIKTTAYTEAPKILPMAANHPLQYQSLGIEPTQDWKEHHIVFNSFNNRQVTLYFGVWDDAKGLLQWKDWKIEEVALLNLLRRPDTPCVVKGYTEGKDYEPISDPRLGNKPWPGDYEVYHQPPVIKTKGIPDGAQLRVSWYHPAIFEEEQVTCCPVDPKTMNLLADEAKRVKAAFASPAYMIYFDEIRCLNHDQSCRKLNLDAGPLLAKSVRDCANLLQGARLYVWSDMFDPHHNAIKDYYLVRGDLAGSWEGLDKSVIIVNWNFPKRDQSLKFFADRGHKQIIAGYYDGQPSQIKPWLTSAANVKNVVGVMYTTWQHKYDDLEEFAKYVKQSALP